MSHVRRARARLDLTSHRRVSALLEGAYAASVSGRGTDLDDLREYVRGDDPKDIDWKASARRGEPLVKRYEAQRRHSVLLVVSTGRSMTAAHTVEAGAGRSKGDVGLEVAGLLGWLAVRRGDTVGVVWGDRAGVHLLPARSGEAHLERCLTAVDAALDGAAPTDLAALLRHVARHVRRRCIVLVLADDDEPTDRPTDDLTAVLRRLTVQHEVLMLTVGDLDPVRLGEDDPAARDAETGAGLPDWLRGDGALLRELTDDRAARRATWHRHVAALGVVHEHLDDGDGVVATVRRLLVRQRHAHRR